MKSALFLLIALCHALILPGSASAHPHVWVQVTSQIVYDSEGKAAAVRHAWKFDDMYSAFAVEGLKHKNKGAYTRDELADLAKLNVANLKEYEFFTFVKADGQKVPLSNAIDYWLDYKSEVLTLNFTLPFKTPIKEKRFIVEVYDPSYFIAMEFTETDSVKLVGAPAQCGASIQNPQEIAADPTNRFGPADLFAVAENPGSNYASRISVRCQ